MAVAAVTLNANLIPTVVLLGSFLVPFCVALFAAERARDRLTTGRLLGAFFAGGLIGVLAASLLEADLTASTWVFLSVGGIEELVKVAVLVVFGWSVREKTAATGGLLGATIGAGFAAFESAGYALRSALQPGGLDLVTLVQTEVLRAVLAPVGHVLWTAVLGAVIFGAARGSARLRWSWWIPTAFVGVALLHALWDSASELALLLTVALTGATPAELRYGFATAGLAHTFTTISMAIVVIFLVLISVLGIIALVVAERLYGRPRRRDTAYRAARSPRSAGVAR